MTAIIHDRGQGHGPGPLRHPNLRPRFRTDLPTHGPLRRLRSGYGLRGFCLPEPLGAAGRSDGGGPAAAASGI